MQAIDAAYFEVHREDLLKRCPGQWVAIFDGRLLGDWPTLGEAYDAAIRLSDSKDVHVRQVVPKDEEPVWIVPSFTAGVPLVAPRAPRP